MKWLTICAVCVPQLLWSQTENHRAWGITGSGGVVLPVIDHNRLRPAHTGELSAGATYSHYISKSSFGFSARVGFKRYSVAYHVNENTTFNLQQNGIVSNVQILILPQKRNHFAVGIFVFMRSYAMAHFTQERGNAHYSYGHNIYHSNPKQAGLQMGYFFAPEKNQYLEFGLEILQSVTPLLKHAYKPDPRSFPEFEIQPEVFPSSLVLTMHYFFRKN